MNYNLIFFCIASAILIFSVIVINLAPIINGLVGNGKYDENGDSLTNSWYDAPCSYYSHIIKDIEDYTAEYGYNKEQKDEHIKRHKRTRTRCNRKQAMAGLEYAAFNLNVILGFVCALLGFLQYLEIKKIDIIGFIGIGCGVVGFVLTLVYVIESGLVFTDYVDQGQERIDSDSAILKWDDSKKNYKCIFYKEDDENSCTIRYSDYGNKYLNYRKEISFLNREKNWELEGCTYSVLTKGVGSSLSYHQCKQIDKDTTSKTKLQYYDDKGNDKGECDRIYFYKTVTTKEKKNLYDHWVTTIILSCFIIVLNIGLALFGFLLFNTSGQTKY